MALELDKNLEALLQNPEELNRVIVDDTDQTIANLAELGIEMSSEEVEDLRAFIAEGLDNKAANEELSESDLENVSGGYYLYCSRCEIYEVIPTRVGVTAFFLKHRHGKKGGYAQYAKHPDAMKWGFM